MTPDPVARDIVAFALDTATDDLAPAVLDALDDHIVDAWGCAIAGLDEPPSQVVRGGLCDARTRAGVSVLGSSGRYVPDAAAFANATFVRVLDYNDTYNSRTGGHPSDMIAGVFAAAECANASGADVLRGVYVVYEVFAALAAGFPLRDSGWDQSAFIAVATAAGISSALRLDSDAAANAVLLAVTASNGLRVTRSGELSHWKGAATPFAVRNAVALTRLAHLGMTGPEMAFVGRDGFIERVGGPLPTARLREHPRPSAVERTAVKFLPVEWCAQAPVERFLALRETVRPADIESITVHGYDFLWREIGGGRDDAQRKWDPRTRETADHSLPFLIAAALVDGKVDLDTYRPERISDPALRPLMNRISVVPDAAATAAYPTHQPVRIDIRLRNGDVVHEACDFPFGHPARPATAADVDEKFRTLADRVGAVGAEDLLRSIRSLRDAKDLSGFARSLRRVAALPAG